ncbi:alpha/beta fold hydrolase [Acuticoccus sp. MNP-M23]|uniref:alpha/beta fold hydrolase n=1 Tax=Acuticoccus sp. MNP-M23 TaxID=3072793 RepID=UPI0028169224|nr:alpha/beta fold hydrolase [Acuticoccus sp. MNP-M23]WMS43964.1 alpha/beta fold hydrolase [Acuticoccus sp. MNP-M23]
MTATLTMPRLGETMEEGRIVSWLIAPGTSFARGDALIEVETDKTVVEFPALGAGTLTETLVAEGDMVKVGAPIAKVEIADGPDWTREGDEPAEEAPAAPAPEADGEVVVDLPMPRLGETMEEGKIVGWMVETGASYKRGDPILELETDKTVAEFPALTDGTLVETLCGPGDVVKVGAAIARVSVAKADAGEISDEPAAAPAPEPESAPAKPAAQPARSDGAVRATPLARRIARQKGVDIAAIDGSGRRGRVERADVERAAEAPAPVASTGAEPAALTAADVTAPVPKFGGIAYVAEGPESGDPVLLIHGYSGDHIGFAALVSGLKKAGRYTVAVDLPSHGQTERDAASLEALTQGLPELAQHLFGDRRPHIIAHSMGAIPAATLAASLKATALTLIAPAGLGLKVDGEFLDGMADAQSVGEVEHLLRRISEAPLPLSQEILGVVFAELKKGRLRALAAALHTGGKQKASIRGALAALAETIPISILLGGRDRILDPADALDVSPRIAVHHFPRAGHVPHWEAPAETLAIILSKGA